ncbi:MAG TPA: hypothetical protein VHO23_00100 [Candidatus Paceibacterota bacterium]|nr:hypothetical protein [Candidatus Paceibacterota bacterium]
MRGTIVAVLRGGPSCEHEVSLKTGHAFLAGLPEERYTVRDIYIDRDGAWHERGRPTSPARVLPTSDAVVNALHGAYGEDGTLQKLLESYGVPYTGADSFGSYLAHHKVLAKERARELGLLTPRYALVEMGSDVPAIAQEVNRTFCQPVVVKPVRAGSSYGVMVLHGFEPIRKGIELLLAEDAAGVLVEEYVRGTHASAGVIEQFRNEGLYGLPPSEVVFAGGSAGVRAPGRFAPGVRDDLTRQARAMHEGLGLRHFSASDFIVSPKGIYYLETDALPTLAPGMPSAHSLEAMGIGLPEFSEHLVALARKSA